MRAHKGAAWQVLGPLSLLLVSSSSYYGFVDTTRQGSLSQTPRLRTQVDGLLRSLPCLGLRCAYLLVYPVGLVLPHKLMDSLSSWPYLEIFFFFSYLEILKPDRPAWLRG